MLRIFFLTALLAPAAGAVFSWHYNQAGGFGLYQPEGWSLVQRARLSELRGPARERERSHISAGSDWQGRVRNVAELKAYVEREAKGLTVSERENSGLPGFGFENRFGGGAAFYLRGPQNVIELRYELRGSPAQVSEAREILSSLEIRTGGIEYPKPQRGSDAP